MTAITEIPGVLSIDALFAAQQQQAVLQRTEPVGRRKERLEKLRKWIQTNRPRIHAAAFEDFRKAAQEVDAIEIFHVLNEIRYALGNLDTWVQPRKVDAPVTLLGTRSYIQAEPRGVCLIISPWNYPFSLAVGPLVSALAAGNTAILKPSELTPNVSRLLSEMMRGLFRPEEVSVIEGGPEVSQALLRLPFNHIFFTGSPAVGKIVMKAAAEHLSSITLELGGKSPAFVTADANLDDAAERIAVGKFVNNGQTCVAPDYILADEKIKATLIRKIVKVTGKRFFDNGPGESSAHYCRIVNDRHMERLLGLVADAVEKGATVEWSGDHNPATRFFHPVILGNVSSGARVLEEEIFGPVLPVIGFKDLADAIGIVNSKPKPLGLYVFSSSLRSQELIIGSTSAGGVCVNDCGIQFLHHHLPFGGVNNSGIGKSHGYQGFLAFSNEKPVLRQRNGPTTLKPFYPPYTPAGRKLMDWFLKLF